MPSSGARTTNTFQEELSRLHQAVVDMKRLPDADYAWVSDMETAVLKKFHETEANSGGNSDVQGLPQPDLGLGSGGMPPSAGMGGMGGPGMGGGMAPPMEPPMPMAPQGTPGLQPGMGGAVTGSADELRRMLQQ